MVMAALRRLTLRARQFPACTRLVRNDSGGAAVEFGLVAAPFLALLVALFETGIVFLATRELDEVAAQSSRYIMTGQAQTSNMSQAQFANYVCSNNPFSMLACSKLMISVQSYASFAASSTTTPTLAFNGNGNVTNAWPWSPGNPGDIVVLQLMYQWPIVLAPLGFNLSNLSNGNRLLVSTAVFKNEPY
jgi:Flp pilus assembly protein TadG